MKLQLLFIVLPAVAILSNTLYAQMVAIDKKEFSSFLLTSALQRLLYIDTHDDWSIHKAAELLRHDMDMNIADKI